MQVLRESDGLGNPSGKIPFTALFSEAAVQSWQEDVPGYLESSAYPLFKYNEGLSYYARTRIGYKRGYATSE